MAVKTDMRKEYDILRWNFIELVLKSRTPSSMDNLGYMMCLHRYILLSYNGSPREKVNRVEEYAKENRFHHTSSIYIVNFS